MTRTQACKRVPSIVKDCMRQGCPLCHPTIQSSPFVEFVTSEFPLIPGSLSSIMIQPRICDVFGGTCDHRDTLLQIPLSIRWRIFLYAGVVRNLHIEGLDDFDFDIADDYDVPSKDYMDTKALLRTCTQMSAEIQGFLFHHNTVIYTSYNIRYWLEQLSWSSPVTVCRVRDIYITLQKQQRPCDWPRIDQPPLDWELIKSWQCAIANILSNVPSRTLRLHLVCQTADIEKAKAVLALFRDFPGVLLELELCISWENLDSPVEITKTAEKMIRDLVQEAAFTAQWRDEVEPGKGFRFLDLPLKLRQLVYTYTSLATPYRKFTYRPNRAFAADFVFCECDRSVCLDENTHWNNDVAECGVDRWSIGMYKPFCKRLRSAYSPRCRCGCSPVALLLTCRAIYDEALEFFYSYNRLVIHPPGPMRKVVISEPRGLTGNSHSALRIEGGPDVAQENATAGQVEATDWEHPLSLRSDATWSLLQRISPGTAPWLRNIEVIFPPIDATTSLTDADPAYSEWLMAVAMLARVASQHDDKNQSNCKSSGLTLALHISTTENRESMHGSALTLNDSYEQATRLLTPLKILLPYLRRLFVFLEWHEHWSAPKIRRDIAAYRITKTQSPGCGIGDIWIPESKPELAKAEMNLEKLVMGSKYDAYMVGKGNEMPSPWLRNLWNGWDG